MAEFEHVITRSDGPDDHMIGLGDLEVFEAGGQMRVYAASGMDGGVGMRTADTLQWQGGADYAAPQGLSAPRELHRMELDGVQVLLAPGQYGNQIDAWQINGNGTLGAARPLTLSGADGDANRGSITALEQFETGGQHVFVTASRYADGLEVWVRDGTTLRQTGRAESSDFLDAGSVQAMALATPGGVPYVLAASSSGDDLVAFQVTSGGSLGSPVRLDLRDGLYIDTPTHIETVEIAGQSFAILGSAGSSSVSVVGISANGTMRVTEQVNDTVGTYFDNLANLEVLETPEGVFVLASGTDNGLTLMALNGNGQLAHVTSLDDEMREMALMDTGDIEMVWRDGGLDIFVSGEVLEGDNAGGRGLTQLRVDDLEDNVPQVVTGNAAHVLTGTSGIDVFRVADTDADQVIRGYDRDVDQLDLSQMGLFYDIADLSISRTPDGAVFQLGEAQVTVFTEDGGSLRASDLTTEDLFDLWHVDVTPLVPAAAQSQTVQAIVGGAGADLLDGRNGADMLLGQPMDASFDGAAAQVYRLYQATLDRAPDVNGLMNWSARLESGERNLLQVVEGFTGSAEFTQTYGSTSSREFVTLLYNNVLDRAPDATGLANWSGRIDEGVMSRAQVVQGFSESAEFINETAAPALAFSAAGLQAEFADDVYRMYRATLDRDPDLNGFSNWSERMADGMTFITAVSGFTRSAEFTQTYGATSDQGFVTLLYDNVLDRAPDAAGLANWSGRLESGAMSREQVVQGFAQSSEFIIATMPDLGDWIRGQGVDDVLDGAGGHNIVMGGLLSDTFVFRAADNGDHVVVDVEPWDTLRMEGFGYGSAQDVARYLSVDGGDVVFADEGVSVRFLDADVASLLDMEFEF